MIAGKARSRPRRKAAALMNLLGDAAGIIKYAIAQMYRSSADLAWFRRHLSADQSSLVAWATLHNLLISCCITQTLVSPLSSSCINWPKTLVVGDVDGRQVLQRLALHAGHPPRLVGVPCGGRPRRRRQRDPWVEKMFARGPADFGAQRGEGFDQHRGLHRHVQRTRDQAPGGCTSAYSRRSDIEPGIVLGDRSSLRRNPLVDGSGDLKVTVTNVRGQRIFGHQISGRQGLSSFFEGDGGLPSLSAALTSLAQVGQPTESGTLITP